MQYVLRRSRKWTADENKMLISLVENSGVKYKEIAKLFNCTPNACCSHYHAITKDRDHDNDNSKRDAQNFTKPYRCWTDEETEKLLALYQDETLSLYDIATILDRTYGACSSRLQRLRKEESKKHA